MLKKLLLLPIVAAALASTSTAQSVDSDDAARDAIVSNGTGPIKSDLDVNPATADPTGFVLADGLPTIFRSFAPGRRHLVLLNPARMSDVPGFIVSQYLPDEGPQVGVSLVAGRDATWLVSIVGSRRTTQQTVFSSLNTTTRFEDLETENVSTTTSSAVRVSRLVGGTSSSGWRGAVGVRLGLQRVEDSRLSISESLDTDVSGDTDATRFQRARTNQSSLFLDDDTVLRGGVEVGLYNGRTDVLVAAQMDYNTRNLESALIRRDERADSIGQDLDPLFRVDRILRLDETESSQHFERPGYRAGVAVRSLVAKRGPAEHYAVFDAGASYIPATLQRTEFQKSELAESIFRNGNLLSSTSRGDSARVASSGKPLNRDIFVRAAYVHRQDIGRVTLTTGIGASTFFGLALSGESRAVDESVQRSRDVATRIDWLVPAFMNYRATPAVSFFAGVIFDLEYNWSSKWKAYGPPQNLHQTLEARSEGLSAIYKLGAMVNQAGFYGQVGFANNLTDFLTWQVTLGLDL